MAVGVAEHARGICSSFPEVSERESHGAPAFFVGKQFAMLWPDGHHEATFPQLWCAAPAGVQASLIGAADRYFRPPYVGHRGWVGIRLDGHVDWDEVRDVLEDAYRTVATPRLIAQLDRIGEP